MVVARPDCLIDNCHPTIEKLTTAIALAPGGAKDVFLIITNAGVSGRT
jgi:hypothetical protein